MPADCMFVRYCWPALRRPIASQGTWSPPYPKRDCFVMAAFYSVRTPILRMGQHSAFALMALPLKREIPWAKGRSFP